MNHYPQNHGPRPIRAHGTTTTTMEPARDEKGNPSSQDLVRHGLHDPNIGARARGQPQHGDLVMSQRGAPHPAAGDQGARGARRLVDNGVGGLVSNHEIARTQQLVGQALALADRKRVAGARISRGGWAPHVAGMAAEYIRQISWKDVTGRMSCVRYLIKGVEGLGQFCGDAEAIRRFLDRNIHKLVAFHAMERDHRVPECIVRTAGRTTRDGLFKHAWFWAVLQEYQGLGRAPAGPWLAPYRAQDVGAIRNENDFTGGPGHIYKEVFSGETTVGSPATPELRCSLRQQSIMPTLDVSQTSLDIGDHTRKRKRDFDETEELDLESPTTKIKTESAEDGYTEMPGDSCHGDTSAAAGGEDGGRDKGQVGRRTLTLLFHGMRRDDAKESEHVQVYVPRTAKGVTINFL